MTGQHSRQKKEAPHIMCYMYDKQSMFILYCGSPVIHTSAMSAMLFLSGEETSESPTVPRDIYISSVLVTVLYCNYVLVHAAIDQHTGESVG